MFFLVAQGPLDPLLVEALRVGPLAVALAEADVEAGVPESSVERGGIDGVDGLVVARLVGADEVVGGSLGPLLVCTIHREVVLEKVVKATSLQEKCMRDENEKVKKGDVRTGTYEPSESRDGACQHQQHPSQCSSP